MPKLTTESRLELLEMLAEQFRSRGPQLIELVENERDLAETYSVVLELPRSEITKRLDAKADEPGTFKLHIKLGNAAMQDPEDVANALLRTLGQVRGGVLEGGIRDLNGNTVGAYAFTSPDEPPGA